LAVCWTSACAADDADDSGADTVADSSTSNGSEESSGADSSTGDAPIPSLLEQCEAPEPCDPYSLDPGSNTEEVHPGLVCAVDQALDSIANGTAAELQSSFCDIGCSGADVLLVGDGTAYIQTWTQTDATYYESIQRCSLKDASYFEPCAGPPPTNACSSWTAWMESCEVVETVTCPS
jgi:hypothetical protein